MKAIMGEASDLLLDDLELLMREINEFSTATNSNKPVDISHSLENYLQFVAKSGNTVFPWPLVRTLFRAKMVSAIQQFQEPICPVESFVLERFDLFRLAAPFTVQRLTELILQPTRHYRKKEKFLRGLEKTVLVVSTVEPRSLTCDEEKNGTDINNTSVSCDGDAKNVVFNRTFTRHENVSSPVVTTPNTPVVSSETIIIDSIASSGVSASGDVISQSIVAVSADGVISESVTSSGVPEMITSDITIDTSSESIIMDDGTETGVASDEVNIETDENTPMECESSSTIESSPDNILDCVSEQDLVTVTTVIDPDTGAGDPLAEDGPVLTGVSSSLVNVNTVKLPVVEEPDSAKMECQLSSIPVEPKLQTEKLLQGVTTDTDDHSAVLPLEPTVTVSDPVSLDPIVSEPESESALVLKDVSPSLVNIDEDKDAVSVQKLEDLGDTNITILDVQSCKTVELAEVSAQKESPSASSSPPKPVPEVETASLSIGDTNVDDELVEENQSKPSVVDETSVTTKGEPEAAPSKEETLIKETNDEIGE